MADKRRRPADAARGAVPVRVVIATLDAHLADALERARGLLAGELPRLELRMHVAADFTSDATAAARCRADIARADVVICAQLWTAELAGEVIDAVAARRDAADAAPTWEPAAESELRKIPFFVRGKARRNTERYAGERGLATISLETLYDAKAHHGR